MTGAFETGGGGSLGFEFVILHLCVDNDHTWCAPTSAPAFIVTAWELSLLASALPECVGVW